MNQNLKKVLKSANIFAAVVNNGEKGEKNCEKGDGKSRERREERQKEERQKRRDGIEERQ